LVLAVFLLALVGAAGLCREDDTPAPARAYRGTTSLAVQPDLGQRPLVAGYDGPDPPGSSQAAPGPFFRKLPGDSRINAVSE
jgi:hypothetical protein